MSNVVAEARRRQQPVRHGFPPEARTYLLLLALAAILAVELTAGGRPTEVHWAEFGILLVVAAGVQFFAAPAGGSRLFHVGLAFTMAAALLLPPELVVVVCVGQHLAEWPRRRSPWFVQSFNIANYVLSSLAAWSVWHALGGGLGAPSGGRSVAAALAAAAVFVAVNHALLARMLKLACGRSSGETALFTADALVTDIVVACIGIGLAFALRYDPALAVIAAMPILLIHRALVVPTLREQAYRDHKTGLLNARGLEDAAEHEFVRATRFDRPLSLLLCDVDDLRGINNRHGHLAGDAALQALADTFCAELRDYDLCGRFGGDEFVVILPETALDEALSIAGRVEAALASRTIHAGRNEFRFSVSIGAAIHEGDLSLSDLIARADAAMYDAKRSGNAPQPAAA